MASNAFFTIPIPVPVEVASPHTLSTADELEPRDKVEEAVVAEIHARNLARKEALLPLVDIAVELRHFRENRSLIEYSRWLRANIQIFERLQAKHYKRWIAKNPTKRDFWEPAALNAHRAMGWLMVRTLRSSLPCNT